MPGWEFLCVLALVTGCAIKGKTLLLSRYSNFKCCCISPWHEVKGCISPRQMTVTDVLIMVGCVLVPWAGCPRINSLKREQKQNFIAVTMNGRLSKHLPLRNPSWRVPGLKAARLTPHKMTSASIYWEKKKKRGFTPRSWHFLQNCV